MTCVEVPARDARRRKRNSELYQPTQTKWQASSAAAIEDVVRHYSELDERRLHADGPHGQLLGQSGTEEPDRKSESGPAAGKKLATQRQLSTHQFPRIGALAGEAFKLRHFDGAGENTNGFLKSPTSGQHPGILRLYRRFD